VFDSSITRMYEYRCIRFAGNAITCQKVF
jgi:hypothetical protein